MSDKLVLWVSCGVISVGVLLTVAVHVVGGQGPVNPASLVVWLVQGRTMLTAWQWVCAGAIIVGVVGVVAGVGVWWAVRRGAWSGTRAARLAGRRRDSRAVRRNAVMAKAERFGVDGRRWPGYPLGRAVADGGEIMGDWEAVGTTIAGPRTGKTTALAVPFILAAPGPVVATSNKRDLVDATRLVREQDTGERAWVFDPCGITKRPAEFCWNPLTFLTSSSFNGSLMSRALVLSTTFGDAARAAGSRQHGRWDGFWDGGGDRIRAQLLAAAAVSGRSMRDVYRWVSHEQDEEPVDLLRSHGLESMAVSLQGAIDLPPETRGGLWAAARMGLGWIEDPDLEAWWDSGKGLDEFDPAAFAQSHQTLYSLSTDSSAVTALVAALTAVTCLAAEWRAEVEGGRLPVPMMVVLDEAANVCPWRELPKLYSHFGSKGVCLQTILQSWSQGVDVWGETGMAKLWSASNTAVFAGGVKEVDQLERISKLIGTWRPDQFQVSTSGSSRSTSVTREGQERPIVSVDELASLPAGRAWLLASQSRPVLVELVPWFNTKYRSRVEASLAVYGPHKL